VNVAGLDWACTWFSQIRTLMCCERCWFRPDCTWFYLFHIWCCEVVPSGSVSAGWTNQNRLHTFLIFTSRSLASIAYNHNQSMLRGRFYGDLKGKTQKSTMKTRTDCLHRGWDVEIQSVSFVSKYIFSPLFSFQRISFMKSPYFHSRTCRH
jgi:hypothetical protein